MGPVEEAKFMEAARAGVVTGETLVWHAGLDEWKSWASVRPAEMPDGAALAAGATLGGDAGPPADADGTVPFEFHGKWEEFFKNLDCERAADSGDAGDLRGVGKGEDAAVFLRQHAVVRARV